MRVLDDLTGADPIGSRVNPPAPREPRTIVSASAPVNRAVRAARQGLWS